MPKYPFEVNVMKVPTKYHRKYGGILGDYALRIGQYINEDIEKCGLDSVTYSYGEVASHTKVPVNIVELLLGYNGGGGNGITIFKENIYRHCEA